MTVKAPCKYCGGPGVVKSSYKYMSHRVDQQYLITSYVECRECKARGPLQERRTRGDLLPEAYRSTEVTAVEFWNYGMSCICNECRVGAQVEVVPNRATVLSVYKMCDRCSTKEVKGHHSLVSGDTLRIG